jgi:transglutaminase-like putative cysteine protease
VPKAILLAACLRAVGIPAAVGFADVRNHLNTPKLQELMGTDLFIYHGYVQLWLDGKAYKVTPAFNMDLCERFGVKPLVFDGKSDALFHEFNVKDQRHMEYVNDRGLYADAPIEEFLRAFKETYPKLEEFNRKRVSRSADGVDAGFAAAGRFS